MVVAVVAVRMVQPAVDQVVDVIAVRHGVVATARAVGVTLMAAGRIGVAVRMLGIDPDHVLIDVILMRVMQMAVMEVVHVTLVANRRMTAAFPVDVRVFAFMNRVCHAATLGGIGAAHQAANDKTRSWVGRERLRGEQPIADESGATVGKALWADTLGPKGSGTARYPVSGHEVTLHGS